jgi:AraC-like DNA-binding protein
MITLDIEAENSQDIIEQLHQHIGGEVIERWNETVLTVKNEYAIGTIKHIPFDWGMNLMDYDIRFRKEIIMKIKATDFNPIRFLFVEKGSIKHRFGVQNQEETIDQSETLIFTNKTGGYNYIHFPKNEQLAINVIQIVRKSFLKKRTSNVSMLNRKLYEIFVDEDHENRFVHHGTLNLVMADQAKKLRKIKAKGMARILKIEAKIYEILSLHIQQHNRMLQGVPLPTSLVKSELRMIRKLGEDIMKNPAEEYTLEMLSMKSGLSQAKLQDGFKFLYTRTVTEYIRHVRLEAGRDLIKNTDLNISQVVYSIGFTSRSYFSKIFREKYGVTPNQFKRQVLQVA